MRDPNAGVKVDTSLIMETFEEMQKAAGGLNQVLDTLYDRILPIRNVSERSPERPEGKDSAVMSPVLTHQRDIIDHLNAMAENARRVIGELEL